MNKNLSRSLLGLLLPVFVALAPACASETEGGAEQVTLGVGKRPADFVERFPDPAHVRRAMDLYAADPAAARMHEPIGVPEFFGQKVTSSNIGNLRIERLRPEARYDGSPLAFLSAYFHGTDGYWNNRYKDVQLYRLFDAVGARYVFPEAKHVPLEGRALVRIWTDYHPVSKGVPENLPPDALKVEVARMLVSSYVAGNVDGPAANGNNGGFARFKDVSGRELWRGVLIDNGAAWNSPGASHKPWATDVLNTGPVERANIPSDVVEALVKIAEKTRTQLAELSKFETIDDGAKAIVEGERARAREVLDHYGIPYDKSATGGQ